MKFSLVSAVSLLAASSWAANPPSRHARLAPPVRDGDTLMFEIANAAASPEAKADGSATTGVEFFTQLINHDDPTAGTFQQRYYWNSEFWGGPGSPVVFFTPGEADADPYGDYLTNATVVGLFAQEIKGAVILVEHRYWGQSSPYLELNAETLQQLTLKNAIADFVNIANTVDLPFDTNHSSNADKAPWVNSGGSYAGSLAAWTEATSPGTFWAYHATSAPVQAIQNYLGMPANCSSDVSLVVDYVDNILTTGTASEISELKAKFGLEVLEHDDDFASVLAGPTLWQSVTFTSGYSGFYAFCDLIEGVEFGDTDIPDENGVGLEKALANYVTYVNNDMLPYACSAYGGEAGDLFCLDSYNASSIIYTETNVNSSIVSYVDRQWIWMLCNEPFGWWQSGAPEGQPSLISRLVTAEYYQQQCDLYFPTMNGFTYGSANPDITPDTVNEWTQGWTREKTTRLIWTNGEFDPWRTASVSSEFRPGGPLASTPEHPLQVIPGGIHCSDLRLANGEANEGVQKVIDNEVAQIVTWVQEFYDQ